MRTFHIKRRPNRQITIFLDIEPYIKRALRGPKAPHYSFSTIQRERQEEHYRERFNEDRFGALSGAF
jgi:hypothetical protein